MAGVQKEKFEGHSEALGRHVKFNREWGGVRFTDEQCEALLKGEEIRFTATSKSGNDYEAYGTLEDQTFTAADRETGEEREIQFVGFRNRSFDPKTDANGNEVPPDSFAGHTFSEEEKQKLTAGERIFVDDYVSKKGNAFAATTRFDFESGSEKKKIILEFGD